MNYKNYMEQLENSEFFKELFKQLDSQQSNCKHNFIKRFGLANIDYSKGTVNYSIFFVCNKCESVKREEVKSDLKSFKHSILDFINVQ